jgi:hypothetical protein
VDIKLPKKGEERRVEFPVERCEMGGSWAEAVVVKDAGDDPTSQTAPTSPPASRGRTSLASTSTGARASGW